KPFLSALAADLHLPLIGDVHLSTVLLFDLGVYMLVIGAVVLMLVALAHQSLRSPRRVPVEPSRESAEETDEAEAVVCWSSSTRSPSVFSCPQASGCFFGRARSRSSWGCRCCRTRRIFSSSAWGGSTCSARRS